MESSELVKHWPDLTGSVQYTKTEIYWDGPCSGLATIADQPGHWFLLMDDGWGEDKLGRLFALYCLTRVQIADIEKGRRGPVGLPTEQLVGWTTDIGEYVDEEGAQEPVTTD